LRSVLIPVLVAAVCYGLGLLCMWEVWKTRVPFDDYLEVLIFFAFGILFGLIGGVALGRAFWSDYVRSRRGITFVLPLAVLNVVVFILLGAPLPTQNVDPSTLWMSMVLPVLAAFLVALNAYLLGLLLVPGRRGPSRERGFRWMVPLYASILAGIIIGFQSGIWRMGTVPLEPWKEPGPPRRRMTLEEAAQDADTWFPPEITLNESDPKWVAFHAPAREAVEIMPGRGVVEATGPVATIGDRELKILGYAIHPPRFEESEEIPGEPGSTRFVKHESGPTAFWAPDGTALDGLPSYESEFGAWNTWEYQCKFCLSVPEGWGISAVHRPTLQQIPWGEPRGGGMSSLRKDILWTQHTFSLPVPSPVELRLGIFDTEKKGYTMPAREGEELVLERNRLKLVKILPWAHTSTGGGVGNTLRLGRPAGEETENGSVSGPCTTAMFYCIEPQGVEIEAVLRSGESVRRTQWISTEMWLGCKFKVKMDDIREFRILEEPEVFEVVFHLPEIKGFPAENDGVTNRLDILYPRVFFNGSPSAGTPFRLPTNRDRFFRSVLFRRFVPERAPFLAAVPAGEEEEPVTYENITVREILDLYYPGRWWVSGGRVYATSDRFGPIVSKVKEAAREVFGGRQ
jgi:hypothetical protein